MIFVATNIYVIEPNFCMLSCFAKYTSGELITIFERSKVFILNICMLSFVI
jgi:hypothetical protein